MRGSLGLNRAIYTSVCEGAIEGLFGDPLQSNETRSQACLKSLRKILLLPAAKVPLYPASRWDNCWDVYRFAKMSTGIGCHPSCHPHPANEAAKEPQDADADADIVPAKWLMYPL